MTHKNVKITTEYIKLQDLLKFSNVVVQGSEAKYAILEGSCKIDGETILQRGKKIYTGMEVVCDYKGEIYRLVVIKG